MKTISTSEEFSALIGSDGKVTETVKLTEGCYLYNLPEGIKITVSNLTEEEKQKLSRIPLDHLNMDNWHNDCGTAYCLAGWMETFYPDPEKATAEIGQDHLPNVGHLFFAPTESVRKWLESLRG